jgi:hypothetical protein
VTQAAPGPTLQLHDVAEYFGVGSFVDEIPAEEVLLLARLVHHRRRGLIPLFPDEEDVGVEWNCRSDKLLFVLL